MSVTASMLRRYSVAIGWAAFAAINFAVMPFAGEWEPVPFHFVWVSLTIVYGFRDWRPWPTASALGGVVLVSGVALVAMADHGQVSTAELTEVPLMGAMFVAMVWHARRRQAALEELRRVTDRERDFVRDASHELRTPITIARAAERLLLLAAVEHPGFLHRSRVDVDALVTETERRWRASAPRDWRVETRAGGSVPADGERLSYALDALIENAVKFTSDGGSISIRARRAGATAVIEVHDDGPGVPAAEAERVFEPFARAGGVRGTGLGLPIVKAIAEAHGGSIALVAGPAGGATFELRLPGF